MNRAKKPHLTNKVLTGLDRILAQPRLVEAVDGKLTARECRDIGISEADIDAAARARRWVADMLVWRRHTVAGTSA